MKPERIGRFDIIDAIEGNAYIARDPTLGREVVLRVVERASGPEPALRREALPTPVMLDGFASLHEIGHDGAIVFAVFERLEGTPLASWARGSGRTEPELASVFRDLASKLAALHATGAAHGALVETSIVIAEGRVRVVDLGLADLSGTKPTSDADDAAFRALWLRTLDAAKLRAPRALRHALASARPMSAWGKSPPRSRRVRNIGIGVAGAAVLVAGAWGIARERSQRSSSPSAQSAPLTTTPLVDFAGCSADPMFSDDDTRVFSHRGDRKSGR
jgi:serine/threonine protein kinase